MPTAEQKLKARDPFGWKTALRAHIAARKAMNEHEDERLRLYNNRTALIQEAVTQYRSGDKVDQEGAYAKLLDLRTMMRQELGMREKRQGRANVIVRNAG